ncbi:MAG: FkbM family methyltransferase [Stellaceae bacterium]
MIPKWLDRALSARTTGVSSHYHAYKCWRWGDPHLHLVGSLCRADKLAIDIGANCGEYTYVLRHAARACIAFEPNPELADLLRRRFPRGVIMLPHAVSDQRGRQTLRIPQLDGEENLGRATIEAANRFEQFRGVTVETVRLDDMALTDIGLVKIDVEGHEKAILDGALDTLRRERPNLLIELEERHRPGITRQVFDLLSPFGYHGLFLWDGKMLPQHMFDPAVHQQLRDGQPAARYAWNFVFTTDDAVLARVARWTVK